jgi:hypothetical protein
MRVSWEELKRALAGAAYLTALMILVALAVRALGPLESVVAFFTFFASSIALAHLTGLDAVGGAAIGIFVGLASMILLSACLAALTGSFIASLAAALLGAGITVGSIWLIHRLKRGGIAPSSRMAEASPWLEE